MSTFRLALAQINTTVGDLAGNEHKIVESIHRARALGADLVAFPELAVTGYPPEDLLLKPSFVQANRAALERIAEATQHKQSIRADESAPPIAALVGFVDRADDIYNAAALLLRRPGRRRVPQDLPAQLQRL